MSHNGGNGMLEVRNLCKTYYPKKGNPVVALDTVNLAFEETGMTFVLGKSGSGKSTLLNLMGGLDNITSGEVVIKGKSSADFSQSDFDSYRNTFIGFIFQEYNILDEFSVGHNIALALELQGKKADRAAVERLLETVDLAGFADRKPAELSGGQKQRVAIARALIKDPEIIMADEPTGALDSNTGKQVFETLQKLSRHKLVIIVSHDREYAEYYGDRVIEFADGRVISDIKKYKAESQVVSEGIRVIDGKILHIQKGHKFTPAERENVIKFLENSDSELILSKDEKSNRDFRQQARIDGDGNKESFAATGPENTPLRAYNADDFKLIKSRLPYKHSLKMGANGLKVKPVRLVFTILLSAIAFALFGLSDTMAAYNKADTT
ncbi:MAG: ABC transporter ATP-binding protein, partial [Clostridiales bacterium]|nr:ABC transporter ATP-binding protein [Clostridiales bacterium]